MIDAHQAAIYVTMLAPKSSAEMRPEVRASALEQLREHFDANPDAYVPKWFTAAMALRHEIATAKPASDEDVAEAMRTLHSG